MTTVPNSDAGIVGAEPVADEAAHADLVSKLVAEAFSQFSATPEAPSSLPSAPKEIPGVPSLYKTEASSAVPPVHPSAQPAAPKLAGSEKTPTGAHTPDSGDSYAFGEPRCNGAYRPEGNKPNTKTTNTNPLLGFSGAESFATPDYYFVRGGQASGKSPASCQSYPVTALVALPLDLVNAAHLARERFAPREIVELRLPVHSFPPP